MDVYTPENKEFHKLIRNSHPGKGTGRRLTIDEIREIKHRSKNEKLEDVYKDFQNKATREVFKRIYNGETYKAI